MNKQAGDNERQSSSMPGRKVSRTPARSLSSQQCVCATCRELELLADSFVQDVLDAGSLQPGCVVKTGRQGYLQIASRASRVRLMSRICAARVCMGCMERSNSSQRAISVYMP